MIVLKEQDPFHHLGVRIALGACRTFPAPSFYAEEAIARTSTLKIIYELYSSN